MTQLNKEFLKQFSQLNYFLKNVVFHLSSNITTTLEYNSIITLPSSNYIYIYIYIYTNEVEFNE